MLTFFSVFCKLQHLKCFALIKPQYQNFIWTLTTLPWTILLLRPARGAEYCDQFVCLCVWLSTSTSLEPLDRSSRNFLCSSPVAVARSSSGGVAVRCVFPVLWMTSRLVVVGCMAIAALRSGGGFWCLWMPCFTSSFSVGPKWFWGCSFSV